ncbi:MAG: DUF1987 domain-containing protein [Tenuifilaceae bacterium]|jgi:hypothetical protein|nr:DUF1987 domain-containing protein [Bacteroidales bacterium]MDI9515750.1 DUF1987 domain-containing protein [Bacteroidota bacterium]NLH56468.1 DUF1987 domain-containing protein [Rikenellaceae bacterium]OQC64110.1 MAG: hypothetical protein BWX49_00865 [Bacteroidetes bacterium ADurb.Bin008]HNV81413.1 DUF1987 domain-containing protein [Tenuifilaceae bacterium]
MHKLSIKAKKDSPEVLFDPETNIFKVVGICHPENVTVFFQPAIDWLDSYKSYLTKAGKDDKKDIKVIFFFRYFNSASYKYLITLLHKINEFTELGIGVFVEWHYEKDDEEMKESGIELFEFSMLKMPYVCIESEF